jgi:hypothetical protein
MASCLRLLLCSIKISEDKIMKRVKLKAMFVIGLIMSTAGAAFAAQGLTDHKNADAHHSFYKAKTTGAVAEKMMTPTNAALILPPSAGFGLNTSLSGAEESFYTNTIGFSKYGAAVIIEKYQVGKLQEQLKTSRKEKDKTARGQIRKTLAKTKYDLFRDELHFIIDREALKHDYILAIKDSRKELAADKADLNKAKCDLKKEKAAGNNAAITTTSNLIIQKEKEIKKDKAVIAAEKAQLKVKMKTADEVLK